MKFNKEVLSIDHNCEIEKATFDNNAVAIIESVPYLNTFNISLTFLTGSKDETESEYGICHLIEHLVFKNGSSVSGVDLLKKIEDKAGDINAFTGKEETSFEMTCLHSDYKELLPLMFDLVFSFNFTDKQFQKEIEIIIHENNEDYNDYELVIDELIFKNCLPADVGHSIGGEEKVLRSLTREKVEKFYKKYFRFDNLIISICGKCDTDEVLSLISEELKKYKLDFRDSIFRLTKEPAQLKFEDVNLNKKLESVVLNFVSKGPTALCDTRFAYAILNQYLCDGMSSKLFSILREKEGIIYSVTSSIDSFYNSGLYTINTSTNKENVEKVKSCIVDELNNIAKNGIDEDRLQLEKEKLLRAYLMGFDDPLTRSEFFANCELYLKSFSFDVLKNNLYKVNNEQIKQIVKEDILKQFCYYVCE